MLLRHIGRILLAFAAAICVATIMIFAILSSVFGADFVSGSNAAVSSLVYAMVAAAHVVPWAIVVICAEAFALKRWYFFALAGGLTALFNPFGYMGSAQLKLELAAIGLLAGTVYWAVAGRFSGLWRAPDSSPPPEQRLGH